MLDNHKSGYYLGIDGGGTKTEAVIATETGSVVGRGVAGGANSQNLSMDVAYENMHQAVVAAKNDAARTGHEINLHQFESICLGLAGIDTQTARDAVIKYISAIPVNQLPFNGKKFILCNDGLIGLKSATDENWGVCLISSTGSNCYGINQAGQEASAGDWGYLLGDQGSGYALGLKIVHRVIKEYDGRCQSSILTSKVLKVLNLKDPTELIPWAYGGKVPVRDIASLTQLLNDPELSTLEYLADYVSYTVGALINSYRAIVDRLNMRNQTFTVSLVGGLFNLKVPFKDHVVKSIMELTPKAQAVSAVSTPAQGAVKMALTDDVSTLLSVNVLTFNG